MILLLFQQHSPAHGAPSKNPYTVLGVSKEASQDDIRRNYRKLCLKYHPDKNVNKPSKVRKQCEEKFKQVQKAHSQIGDEESRRQYDTMQAYQPYKTPHGNAPSAEDLSRFFNSRSFRTRATPFYFNGVDISESFSEIFQQSEVSSTYVQKVRVPLHDLCNGKDSHEFRLEDSVWKRYAAAFRGGLAKPILYMSLAVGLSTIRMFGPAISLVIAFAASYKVLPKPTKLSYETSIKPGWKTGTKLIFRQVEPGFDVVFIVEEAGDSRFRRVGNNLRTSISISKRQAKEGCRGAIDSLSDLDEPIVLDLSPHQITKSGQQVTIKGKGWPMKFGKRGDLEVVVDIVSKKMANRGWKVLRQ